MNVGVVGNPRYADLRGLLARLAQTAPRHQMTLYTEADLAELWPRPVAALWADGTRLDLLLTFGGDGTLLRGARLLAGRDTAIMGVNLGRVGFLTAATPETMDEALAAVAEGRCTVERRCVLETKIAGAGGAERIGMLALNDVVVHKAGVARAVSLRVLLGEEEVGHFSADGVLVATPTGSTAYALSVGGPVMLPGVDALLIAAVCPHALAVRPIVVPGDAVVTIEVGPPASDDVFVSYDGQVEATLAVGDVVQVRRAASAVRLIRLGKEGFFARLRHKLDWGGATTSERR
jgi:NAD+ kinase